MPDIQAQTPDGVIHSFPDGTAPEVITGAIKKYLGVSARPSEAQQVADRPGKVAPITPLQDLGANSSFGKVAQGQEAETLGNEQVAREWWKQGPAELGRGTREMFDLSSEKNDPDRGPRAFNRMVRGAGVTAGPALANLLPMVAVEAPVATAATLGVGAAAQKGVQKGSEMLGADPEQAEAYGNAAAIAAATLGPKAFRASAPARQAAAEKIVSPITYENLGETKADIRTDINPERGITREGMSGTKKGLAEEKIPARLAELKTAANQILANHPNSGTMIDAEPMIDQAIDNAIGETEKVAGSTERLESLRAALKTKYGPTRGTPAQINDLKTEIQAAARGVGAYKNTQPVEASVASAMSQAARLIRGRVDELIPEAAELNGRMTDLIDAQAGIRSKIAGERGQSVLGNHGRGVVSSILNRTVGSAPLRTGLARVVNIGNKLDIPEPIPARGPASLGRQLPVQTGGPETVSGPSQFGISLPEEPPRPLVGPERQLTEGTNPPPRVAALLGPSRTGPGPGPGKYPQTAPSAPPPTPEEPFRLGAAPDTSGPVDLGAPTILPKEPPPNPTREPSGPKTPPSSTRLKPLKGQAPQQENVKSAAPTEPVQLGPQGQAPQTPKAGVSIFSKPIPNPRETANPARMPTPRAGREQLGNFDPDTLAEAKEAVTQAQEQWRQFERPGRYVIDTGEQTGQEVKRPDNYVYGIKSARPQIEAAHPWVKNLPKLTSEKLRAAVESGKGIEYTRLLNEAAGHIQRAKEANALLLSELGAQLEEAAQSVEKLDPELAQTLRDVSAGKYSGWSGLAKFAKEKLNEADAAAAFDKAVSDLSAEESTEGVQELGPESSRPRQENLQAAELGAQKTLPGLESAVQENKQSAAVELGRKLTEQTNRPAESFNAAAGEMESKSPLFRGSAASPQNEMFSPFGSNPQSIVESAGGKYIGIQKAYGIRPDQVQFQAGEKGTTLSIDVDKLTPEAVREKIRGAKGL
jgi:hypothetical protein